MAKQLEHFAEWREAQEHLVDAELDIVLLAYTETFPGRRIVLLAELYHDNEKLMEHIDELESKLLDEVAQLREEEEE